VGFFRGFFLGFFGWVFWLGFLLPTLHASVPGSAPRDTSRTHRILDVTLEFLNKSIQFSVADISIFICYFFTVVVPLAPVMDYRTNCDTVPFIVSVWVMPQELSEYWPPTPPHHVPHRRETPRWVLMLKGTGSPDGMSYCWHVWIGFGLTKGRAWF
jgi:hypothetical protein